MTTHWRSDWPRPRSAWMDGMATFTTARSRMTMNWAALISARITIGLVGRSTDDIDCPPGGLLRDDGYDCGRPRKASRRRSSPGAVVADQVVEATKSATTRASSGP